MIILVIASSSANEQFSPPMQPPLVGEGVAGALDEELGVVVGVVLLAALPSATTHPPPTQGQPRHRTARSPS